MVPAAPPRGGLERILDEQLRGEPGLIKRVNDPRGRREFEVQVAVLRKSTRGNSVMLTINRALQGIAEDALAEAVNSLSAISGDIVIIEPRSGEIRAIASYSPALGFASSDAFTESYEPGSSIKPLLVSRLLELRRAVPDEVMETGNELEIPGRRTPLTDVKPAPTRTLHETIVHSSNIGMVKFADRLSVREQYEAYRDFGLGMQTGVSLPSEAAGRLLPPARWTPSLKSSTSIGYGLSLTSLQLAMAFGAIANGGELLEPTMVREIRSPDGGVIFRHAPRPVRRVMSAPVAAQVRAMLRDVVVQGTASSADIALGELAGKTGTARYSAGPSGYVPGKHTATFAGMFPAGDPQFVIVVRLVDPDGVSGGATAAPVTAAVLKAAAVAQDAALDTRPLIGRPNALASSDASGAVRNADGDEREAAVKPAQPRITTRVIRLDESTREKNGERMARPVPRVAGLPLRDAVYALHQAGFRVRLSKTSGASDGSTFPAAGSVRKAGDLVLLYTSQ